jgi:hypothetical protein
LLWYWCLNSGPSPLATLQALFCEGFFDIGSICLVWLQTMILLIAAFWVSRITGISHRHPASISVFIHEYIMFPPHSPSYALSLFLLPPTGKNPQAGPVLPSYSPFVEETKKSENKVSVSCKISVHIFLFL